jgi:hypothetical protein
MSPYVEAEIKRTLALHALNQRRDDESFLMLGLEKLHFSTAY